MKNKSKRLLAIAMGLAMCVGAIGLAGCDNSGNGGNEGGNGGNEGGNGSNTTEKTSYDITMWVSETSGVKESFEKQVAAFNAQSTDYTINATVNIMGEGEAATQVLTDVESAPDIYCFAQDQLARLVQAGALAAPGTKATATIKEANDAGSVAAASVAGKVYCYPLTADNGYFMYYDKSVVKEEHLDSLEDIIADCEAAGKNFSYNLEGSGWYSAGFFFATGCKSEWTMDTDGNYTSVDDTFNSKEGIIALKGMQKLLQSNCYVDSAAATDFTAAIPSAVVITGTWDSNTAKAALADNMGVTDLPSFTVDGQSYHIGSFSGNKLMGVKPQTDSNKAAALQALALYLTTNTQNQLDRFTEFGWGPSNKEAQASDAVQSDPCLAALAAQSAYATPQGNIHGSWWDIAKAYATGAKNATAGSDAELQTVLDNYKSAIDALFSMSDEEKRAFTVIGSICGTSWDTDYAMTENPTGTWTSDALELKAGDELKCRQGKAWDLSFGNGSENYKVEADGTYKVQLVYDESAGTGVITLIAA